MIDKDYLEQLKEEDYIAYDDLVNDPMITGSDDGSGGCIIGFLAFIVIAAFILLCCY